jgi:hypothetical protein
MLASHGRQDYKAGDKARAPDTRGNIIMNPLAFVNIALHALSQAPLLITDIETVARANWQHPLVQDAAQGLTMLAKLFEDIAAQHDAANSRITPLTGADSGPAAA